MDWVLNGRLSPMRLKTEIESDSDNEASSECRTFEDPLKTNRRYKCEKCDMSYSKMEYLRNHLLKQHNIVKPKLHNQTVYPTDDNPRPYKCDQCEKDYTCKKHLTRHKKQSHEENSAGGVPVDCKDDCELDSVATDRLEQMETPKSKEQLFECDLCDKTYRYTQGLARHKRLHHKPPDQSASFTNYNETNYDPLPTQPIFIKQESDVHIKDEDDAYSEWSSHRTDVNSCDTNPKQNYSDNSSTTKIQVKQENKKITGTNKIRQQCTHCEASYAKSSSLRFHLWRDHGIKVEAQRRHALVPTAENPRPYKCDLCEKDYTCRKHLMRHLKDTHKRTSEVTKRTYEASLKEEPQPNPSDVQSNKVSKATAAFKVAVREKRKVRTPSRNQSLVIVKKYKSLKKKNVKPKTPVNQRPAPKYRHKCTECTNIYVKRTSLSHHMLKHHNLKLKPARLPILLPSEGNPRPYKCEVCEKTYLRKKHLTRHVRKTHEQRVCDICFAPITGSNSEHMRKIHGIEIPRPFECDLCSRKFRTKSHIKVHMRSHLQQSSEKCYTCQFCNKQFQNRRNYQNHRRTHTNSRPVICDICGVTVHYSGLRKHLLVHSNVKPHECSICQRRFREKATLAIHLRVHTGEKPYLCDTCGKGFKDPSTRKVHFRSHTGENPFCCHFCGRRTKQASNLRSHYRYFHKNTEITGRQIRVNSRIFVRFTQEQIDMELLEYGDLVRLLAIGREEYNKEEESKRKIKENQNVGAIFPQVENTADYELPIINPTESDSDDGRSFDDFANDAEDDDASSGSQPETTMISLEIEPEPIEVKIEAKGMEPIESLIDAEKFEAIEQNFETESIKSDLSASDNNESHDVEYEYPKPVPKRKRNRPKVPKCKLCTTKRIDNLAHQLNYHPEFTGLEKPFECFDCHKVFGQKIMLNNHLKLHEEHEPVVCYVCGVTYKTKSRLRKHIKTHSTERPHPCTVCPGRFKTRMSLKNHMRRHTGEKPHQCEICSEQFSLASSLKLHFRRHTGEKPYSCTHCGKSFSDGSTLKQHIRVHTGQKPYVCHLCGKGCTQAGNLKSHYRHFHKIVVKSVSMHKNVLEDQ